MSKSTCLNRCHAARARFVVALAAVAALLVAWPLAAQASDAQASAAAAANTDAVATVADASAGKAPIAELTREITWQDRVNALFYAPEWSHSTPTRLGAPGLLSTVSAFEQPEGHLLLGAGMDFYTGNHNDIDTATTGAFSLHFAYNRWLQVFVAADTVAADGHGSGFDWHPGAMATIGVHQDVSLGLLARTSFLAGVGKSTVSGKATGLDTRFLLTYAPSFMGKTQPLRVHFNTGFTYDNSDSLYPADVITPGLRYASRLATHHRLPASVGLEYRWDRLAGAVEYTAEVPVGDSKAKGFRSWITPSVRVGIFNDVYATAYATVATSESDNLPGVMPWTVGASLGWSWRLANAWDPTDPKVLPMARGRLAGTITDAESGQPIGLAQVAYVDSNWAALEANAEGVFDTGELPVGDVRLRVSAMGYGDRVVAATVEDDETITVDVELEALPPAQLVGRLEDQEGEPLAGVISFPYLYGKQDVQHSVDGDFKLDVPVGEFYVEAQAPEKLATGFVLQTVSGETVKRNIVLVSKPKRVVLRDRRIETGTSIKFETERDILLPSSYAILDEVLEVLFAHPEMRIRIEGHTDATGSDDFNQLLSVLRVESVRAYFVYRGIALSRLEVTGFGSTRPLVAERTSADRAINRRVDFIVLEKGTKVDAEAAKAAAAKAKQPKAATGKDKVSAP